MSKRKASVYSPNLTGNPMYGDVSTLENGLKRVHVHVNLINEKDDAWSKMQILFPECEAPKVSPRDLKIIRQFKVPKIVHVRFDVGMLHPKTRNVAEDCDFLVGLFETDIFSRKVRNVEANPTSNELLDVDKNIEGIFLLNSPIVYDRYSNDHSFSNWSFTNRVSNITMGGHVLLQNYVNLVFAFQNLDRGLQVTFNAYIDYEVCETDYETAKLWASDYESLIDPELMYRGVSQSGNLIMTSRGEITLDTKKDPSQFTEPKGMHTFRFKPTDNELYIPQLHANIDPMGKLVGKTGRDILPHVLGRHAPKHDG